MKYSNFDEYWVVRGNFLPKGTTDREIAQAAWDIALRNKQSGGERPTTAAAALCPGCGEQVVVPLCPSCKVMADNSNFM